MISTAAFAIKAKDIANSGMFILFVHILLLPLLISVIYFSLQVVYSHTEKVGTQMVNPPKQEAKQEEDDDFNIDDI